MASSVAIVGIASVALKVPVKQFEKTQEITAKGCLNLFRDLALLRNVANEQALLHGFVSLNVSIRRNSNSTEILASIVQAVAVLVVNLRPIRTEVFVHLNLRTVNPCNRVGRPLSILICVPVMSPYSVKIFSGC